MKQHDKRTKKNAHNKKNGENGKGQRLKTRDEIDNNFPKERKERILGHCAADGVAGMTLPILAIVSGEAGAEEYLVQIKKRLSTDIRTVTNERGFVLKDGQGRDLKERVQVFGYVSQRRRVADGWHRIH